MSRRTIGYWIIAAWIATLGWLGARRLLTPEERQLERGVGRIGPSTSFYAVLLGGVQVGTASIRLDTLPTGFRLTEQIVLNLETADGAAHRVTAHTEGSTTRGFRLRQASATWSEGAREAGTIEVALGRDTTLQLRLLRPPRDAEVLAELSGERPVLAATVPFHLAALARLRPGATLPTDGVHPLRFASIRERVRVGRDSVFTVSDTAALDPASGRWVMVPEGEATAWMVERATGGLPVLEWVDAQGRTLRREHPFGMVLERSPFEVNYTNYQAALRARSAGSVPRVAGARLLRAPEERPPSGPEVVTVVLSRDDGAAWPGAVAYLAGGRQVASDDTIRIHRRPPPRDGGRDSERPSDRAWIPTADRSALETMLRTVLEANPGSDTLAVLVAWVARDVLLAEGPSAPSGALRAGRTRRAGVEGKARLLAALCEVAGMPARLVSGVDLSRPDLPGHTWVEVWRGEWEAADPLTGDVPASPWLLRVAEGTARPIELTLQVGALRATVVPASRRGRTP